MAMYPSPTKSTVVNLTDSDLLKLYLAAPDQERSKLFADTARAANLTGLSRRTIQFWVETGAIRAIAIGRRYEVYLPNLTCYLETRMEAKSRT
jgi:excisionase family DNA binding protein